MGVSSMFTQVVEKVSDEPPSQEGAAFFHRALRRCGYVRPIHSFFSVVIMADRDGVDFSLGCCVSSRFHWLAHS